MYSAQYGHPAVSKLLLDSGADMRMKDADRDTALALAKLKGHADIVELLKYAGATE
jgi:ankyrin repeat protein